MKLTIHAMLALLLSVTVLSGSPGRAATLASATYDTDSYIFIGTNNEFDNGISTFADLSGGVLDANNSHFNFAAIQFDDLAGIDTVANGGPSKYLTLEWVTTGPAVIGISVAGGDVLNGYPSTSGSYNGPAGTTDDRLQWYFDNIKGDDATYGGYAGGAEHVGVLDLNAAGTYSLDVTSVVDAWIDGSVANYGFGVWAASTGAGQGAALDFASRENPLLGNPFNGPLLTSTPVPEPSSCLLGAMGLAALLLTRKKS